MTSSVASVLWGTALGLAAFAIWMKWLWLLFCSFGVVGGMGLGLAYVSPVSTLIKWFPDSPGMAAGKRFPRFQLK